MVSTGFRCSAESLALGDPMGGTASTVSNWLMLEHAGPWGRRGLDDARLTEGLGRQLRHLERRHRVRVLLIRRPDRMSAGGVTVFAAHTGPDEAWIERTVLGVIDDAVDLDLERLGHGRRPGLEPHESSVFAVCTHGRRDPCCAELGRPLARAIGVEHPDQTWESTHVGGDRFAGNLVAFPHGLYFGRLDPAAGVQAASTYLDGRIDLDHLRGRSCYPMDVQSAEGFLRVRLDATGIDDVRVEVATRDGPRTAVRAVCSGSSFEIVVERVNGEPHRLTCHSEEPEPSQAFSLVSIDPV